MENQGNAERITRYLAQTFPATKNIGPDDPLLKTQLIDSLGILEVVTFLEQEFGITIVDEELLPENFDSIRSISNFVQHKMNVVG